MAEEKPKGRPPDYNLNCLHKPSDARGKVGAAWRNDDGSIRVVLDPFVSLPPSYEIVLTLFKNTPPPTKPAPPARNQQRTAADALDDLSSGVRDVGDEVPF